MRWTTTRQASHFPPFGMGVEVPTEFEHIRAGAGTGRQALQFQFGFTRIAKFESALSGSQMKVVGMRQG